MKHTMGFGNLRRLWRRSRGTNGSVVRLEEGTAGRSDSPIPGKGQDQLERAEFCEKLVQTTEELDLSGGVAIALTGEWGAGKTSCLNMVEETLRARKRRTIRFEAGRWDLTGRITYGLLSTIARLLHTSSGEGARIADDLLKYAPAVCGGEPVAAAVVGAVRSGIQVALRKREARSLMQAQETWTRIEKKMRSRAEPIWVLIDDLDRLDPAETKKVLNAIKMVADLPYIVYVVACDNTVLAAAVETEQANGHAYLEKILTAEFPVPKMTADEKRWWMDRQIDGATEQHLSAREQLLKEIQGGRTLRIAERLMETPRDYKRYGLAISRALSGLGEHAKVLCMTDLFLLEAVRLKAPKAMEVLVTLRAELAGHWRSDMVSYLVRDEPDTSAAEAADIFVAAWPKGARHEAKSFIKECFPRVAMAEKIGNTNHRISAMRTWKSQGRIASLEMLELALSHKLTREIQIMMLAGEAREALDDSNTLRALLDQVDVETGGEVMEELETYSGWFTPAQAVAAVPVLVDKRVGARADPSGMFEPNTRNKYWRVVARLLEKIPENALAQALGEITAAISTLGAQASLLGLLEAERTSGRMNIEQGLMTSLEQGWFERVKADNRCSEDQEAFSLARLARRTAERNGEEWAVPSESEFTMRLIDGASGHVLSESTGPGGRSEETVRTVTPQLDWNGLEEIFGGGAAVLAAMRRAREAGGLSRATAEQKEAYDLAWDYWSTREDVPFSKDLKREEVSFGIGEDLAKRLLDIKEEGESEQALYEAALRRGHRDPSVGAARGLVPGKPRFPRPHEVRAKVNPGQRRAAEDLAKSLSLPEEDVWGTILAAGTDELRRERGNV